MLTILSVLELPVASPLVHEILRTLSHWQEVLTDHILVHGPPSFDYIPGEIKNNNLYVVYVSMYLLGCFVETSAKGPAIHKYKTLLEKENTPFISTSSTGPIKRLWHYLVRQADVQDVFIRAIFGKKKGGKDCDDMSRTPKPETDYGNSESDSISMSSC